MTKDSTRVQYKDFSVWQVNRDISEQEAYWKEEFSGEIPRLNLKTDFPRPQMQSFKGKNDFWSVEEQISIEVRKLAKKYGATEFMVTLSTFMLLLGKYCHQKDIVVGTAISGRTHSDTKDMIGMFVNTLAIKTEVCPDETFESLLLKVKEKCLRAYENQEYPFDDLVECVETKRDYSRNPIFDVMFVLREEDKISKANGLMSGKSAQINRNISKFDLTLTVCSGPKGYTIDFEYCTDLFRQETIKYMAKHYITLLKEVVKNPRTKLNKLHLIDVEEKNKVLFKFNASDVKYSHDRTVIELFEEQVEKTPESIALKYEDKVMRYAELNTRSNQLAATLRSMGVVPENRVALMAERGFEMIVGILGVIKAGGAYVPIDPGYPANRVSYILEDSGANILLICKAEATKEIKATVLDLEDENIYSKKSDNLPHINAQSDLAYCIYTSGTTGKPKGVLIEHRNMVNMLVSYNATFALNNEDVVLQFASIAFDQSVGDIFPALCNGAALCLVPSYMMYDTDNLTKYINEKCVTVMSLTPKVIDALNIDKLPMLRLLESGGDAGDLRCLKTWAKKIQVLNTYGPTESTVNATSYRITLDSNELLIGCPISNTQIYILSDMELCGIGVPGELCIAGDGLARGYLNQPELTAKKFIKNPYGEGKLYRSGDLARWKPDGNIEYLGRIDEQVKIRGYRIELGEIENVLKNQPRVMDAAVIIRTVRGDRCLCAYVIAGHNMDLDITEIKEKLRIELPEYMIPAYIILIDELPLTTNGKLDKRALPNPDEFTVNKYVPPRNKTEQKIIDIYEEILQISPIGIEDSFFELGGHSLKATAVINLIEKHIGVRLPLKEIFASPTPSMLAKKINLQEKGMYSPIPKAEKRDKYPVSSAQKRLFILDQIERDSITYNMPIALEASGSLDVEKIQKTMNALIKRHESLRTKFELIEGEPVQIIVDEAYCQVEYEETDSYSIENLTDFMQPFNLGRAPLIHLKVVKELNSDKYLLLFDIHHIISDGMTMNIIIEDFSRLYSGEELNPLEIQYKDYSEWMNRRNLEEQKEYWKNLFKEEVPVLDLVTDYLRPKTQSYKGACVSAHLNKEQKNGLERINRENGTTDYMLLLAAFMIELHKYSRQDDIVVGTPVSGRVHKDTEEIAGMFVNTLAMRGYPSENKTFEVFLGEVKKYALSAYENQEYPFEKLIEEVEIRRDTSRNPLFNVMFAMMNNEYKEINIENTKFRQLRLEPEIAKFDLTLHVEEFNEGYGLELEYCSDLFRKSTAETILNHFIKLVDSIIENPKARIASLSMLLDTEQEEILTSFNYTYIEYPQDKTLIKLFEKQVKAAPNNVALEYENGTLSYKEINSKANALAEKLYQLGIRLNDRVAIVSSLEVETVIGIIGVLKCGGTYIPIDPDYPKERILYILDDAAPKVILSKGKSIATEIPIIYVDTENLNGVEKNPESAATKNDTAYIIYTSGTTGKPKGVEVTRGNLDNYLLYAYSTYQSGACVTALITSLSFDLTVTSLYLPLISGGYLILKSGNIDEKLNKVLKESNITFLKLTPSHLKILEDAMLPKLESLIVGGEELLTDSARKVQNLLGQNVKIHNEYGPTETTVGCCDYVYNVNKDVGMSVGIGRPIANTQIYILHDKELCGIGVPGELCIAGNGVAKGYLNRPELTEDKFIDNPYGKGRLYRSGDLARWLPDGNLEYLGRIDDQVKIRGYRIELGEIESALRKQCQVIDAAVIVHEVEGNKSLCAYIVSESEKNKLDMSVLKDELRKELPEYMIPSFMMQIDTLPINRNGKLDRKALPKPDMLAGRKYVSPRNKMEQTIIEVYEEILGTSPIGIDDGFFELGGDSIKAIMATSKLRQKGFELSVTDLMRQQTAKLLSECIQEEIVECEQWEVNRECPLTPIQYEFFSKNHVVSAHSNQILMVNRKGKFDIPSLKEAITEIIKHHDVLRNIYNDRRQITLSVDASKLYGWFEYDFTQIEDIEKAVENSWDKIQASINLSEGPLVNIGLFHTNIGDRLMISIHHLVIDAISWKIILMDLFKGYQQIQEEGKISLPKKTTSYESWAKMLMQYADSEVILNEVPYWEDVLKKLETENAFKINGTISGQYKYQHVIIDSKTTQKLLLEAKTTYGTELNDLLLAALVVAVKRWKNNKFIGIKLKDHGRVSIDSKMDLARTVGCFANVYPVVLEAKTTVEETIIYTKETLRRVPNHGLGYGVLKYLRGNIRNEVKTEIAFNNLGEFDNELDCIEALSLTQLTLKECISKKNMEGIRLALNVVVSDKQLDIELIYDTGLYSDEDIDVFVVSYKKAIIEIVETCLLRKDIVKTPSDFGIDISLEALQNIKEILNLT